MQYVNCGRMSLVGVTVLALFLTLANALPLAAADNVLVIKTANTPIEVPFMNMAAVTNDLTIGRLFTVGASISTGCLLMAGPGSRSARCGN